jgi:peroxiredoxin-like protein
MTEQALPHHYEISAKAHHEGEITLTGAGIPTLISAPPALFGGPGDQWSPEDLLVGSVADCFILTFRAIAKASELEWIDIKCSAEGTLERVNSVTQFTSFNIEAILTIGLDTDPEKARKLMGKAESSCLITNSLRASTHLQTEVLVQH